MSDDEIPATDVTAHRPIVEDPLVGDVWRVERLYDPSLPVGRCDVTDAYYDADGLRVTWLEVGRDGVARERRGTADEFRKGRVRTAVGERPF